MRVSTDGKRVEVLSSSQVARRFDLETGKELENGPHDAHSNSARCAVLAADGKIVTLGDDKTIRVWDPKTGRQVQCHSVDAVDYPWQLARVSADGRLIAANDRDGVSVYERDSGKLLGKIGTAPNGLISMDFDPRAPVLRVRTHDQPGKGPGQSVRSDSVVALRSSGDFARNEVLKRSQPFVGSVAAVSQDGRLAASFDLNERIIRVAVTDTQRVIRSFPDNDQSFQHLAFCPDGRGLIVNGNRRFTLWELTSLKERWRVEFPVTWSPDVLSISGDGRWIARADGDSQIHLYDARSGQRVHSFVGHDGWISSIAFAPDQKTLVSASEDSTTLVWDLRAVLDRIPVPNVPDAESIDEAWQNLASPDAALAYRRNWPPGGRRRRERVASGRSDFKLGQTRRRRAASRSCSLSLSSETFVVRERATSELKKMADLEESVARRCYLAQTKSLEAKRRVAQLLQRVREPIADPQQLQSLRAIEALECIGTPAARLVLESLSAGTSKALLTIEAKRSAERLAKRLVSH